MFHCLLPLIALFLTYIHLLYLLPLIDALSVDTLEGDEDDTVEFESAGDGFDNDGVGLEDNDEADRSDAKQSDAKQSTRVEPIPTSDASKAGSSGTTESCRRSGRKRNKAKSVYDEAEEQLTKEVSNILSEFAVLFSIHFIF